MPGRKLGLGAGGRHLLSAPGVFSGGMWTLGSNSFVSYLLFLAFLSEPGEVL